MANIKWKMIRKHIFVDGRVQGVGFRFRTWHYAERLGLTGWVRNLADGRVEMELQGAEEAMDKLFGYLREDQYIEIEEYDEEIMPVMEKESGFGIR